MNNHLKKKQVFMASLEMINSLWYFQTPKRVDGLINILLKRCDEKKAKWYFYHFNKKNNSVESFLISKKDQKFIIDNKKFFVKKNEKIQTEISKKFTFSTFSILAKSAGWKVKKYWFDKNKYYSIFLLQNQWIKLKYNSLKY